MIPFAPAAELYAAYLKSLIALPEGETASFPEVRGRDLARTRIAGGVRLSVPMEGGASVLKRHAGPELRISQHGRWQEVHLGALKAAYGKTPYFTYIYPEIERIYVEKSAESLAEFTKSLHQLVLRLLGFPEIVGSLKRENADGSERLQQLAEGRVRNFNKEYSIFDALFRFGKETIFALIAG